MHISGYAPLPMIFADRQDNWSVVSGSDLEATTTVSIPARAAQSVSKHKKVCRKFEASTKIMSCGVARYCILVSEKRSFAFPLPSSILSTTANDIEGPRSADAPLEVK
jgi:hypothetical protein